MPIQPSEITGVYLGSSSISRVYHGSNLIFGTAPTPPSTKETDAPLLVSKGLTFLNVTDALETANDTNDPFHMFDPNTGARNRQDEGIADRWSIGTYYGKKCLRSIFRANQNGFLRFNSLWLPTRYQEFGFKASVYIPSSFRLVNSTGGDINGKTMFGIVCGPGIGYMPGSDWPARDGNRDHVAVPSLQGGCGLGLNLDYSQSGNQVRFVSYLHVVGGKGSGGVWQERVHKYSHLWAIPGYHQDDGVQGRYKTDPLPRDQWFDLILYAKMDTSVNPPNGVFETWVERSGTMVKEQWAYDLDLGGTIANRPGLGMVRRENVSENFQPDSTAEIGPLYNSAGGGWGLHGCFSIDMLGGAYNAANTPVDNSVQFAADWALYGKSANRTLNVTGGDGTTGTLSSYHPTSEAILPLKTANGFDQFHPSAADVSVVQTPAHPNPQRSNVYRFHWDTSIPLLNGNKRSEVFLPINSAGSTWSEGNTPEFGLQFVYYAVAMRIEQFIQNSAAPYCLWHQFHDSGIEGTGHKYQISPQRGLRWRHCRDTSCTNYDWRSNAPIPLNTWVFLVYKILHGHNSPTGSATSWAMLEGESAFEQFGTYSNQINVRGAELGRMKLGIYVNDDETGQVTIYTTNPVRGSGFASVVKEAFGLTVA